MAEAPVVLHVYDLSMGMARQLSGPLMGMQIEGVWHTGLVVFGDEYFFGGGIQQVPPAQVVQSFGISPVQTVTLGTTSKTVEELQNFLRSISHKYQQTTYDLFHNNCNNFSDEVARFLLNGTGIPQHILDLPGQVLNTPAGQLLAPMYSNMQSRMHEHLIPLHQPGQVATGANNPPAGTALPQQVAAPPAASADENVKVTVQVTSTVPQKLTISLTEDATVNTLQEKLRTLTGYKLEDQRLIFRGKVLNDSNATLASTGVTDGQSVHLVPKSGAVPEPQAGSASSEPASSESLGAQQAAANSAAPATISNARGEALQKIKQCSPESQRSAIQTLLKIIGNIQKDPNEPKFRKLKHANAAFEKRVIKVSGALDYILAMGFKRVEEEGQVFYVLEASAAAWEVLVESKSELEKELSALSGAQTSTATAPPRQSPSTTGTSSVPPMLAGLPGLQNMDPAMIQQMMNLAQNPEMMNMIRNNPMLSNMMSDPAIAQRAMQMFQNPGAMEQMMNDPMVRQLAQNPQLVQQMQQMVSGMGAGIPGVQQQQQPSATPPAAGNVASNTATSELARAQADLEMTEEEMLQEAIRKSMEMD